MTSWIARLAAIVLSVLAILAETTLANTPDAAAPNGAAPAFKPPGLGDPGELREVSIECGRAVEGGFELKGQDARQQLVVTGSYATGQQRDLTSKVTYATEPAGVVEVSPSGYVVPAGDGTTTITATSEAGPVGTIKVTVSQYGNDPLVNFPNQIVPIFTKLSCNGGGCHGKASGQNGFKLSLLGFEPTEDFEHLVKEGRGRRLFPAAPDKSLLLLKAIGAVPHGGGTRMEVDTTPYRLIRRWVLQGMPYGSDSDPTVARIEVLPHERTMPQHGEQQLLVIAHYTDGSTLDVTSMVTFEPNNPEMAEVSATGLVKTLDLAGDVAVMARYQGQVGVFRATVPLGIPVESTPAPANYIDEEVFAKLKTLGVPPSDISDDATFLRRAALDIAGRLPTPEETQTFLADNSPDKRDRWVDTLLASTDYADFFANKWSSILRNKRLDATYARGTRIFHDWIRDSLHANVPYDDFVRQLLTATGEIGENPPVAWYREVDSVNEQVEDSAQLFLGLRIQCARCHHHPFEKWSQQDYYGFAAFFSQLGRKPGAQFGEERVVHKRGMATAKNPKTNQDVPPTGLGAEPIKGTADDDPRHELVDWMVNPENPFFARSLVNRYWKHFFSRGLVDPEDDMRVTNPATNEELLNALANDFIKSGFDIKHLVRTICTSKTYQLSSLPNDYNAGDKQNYSRYYPKRLPAEVLLDSIDDVTGSKTQFAGLPQSVRAIQLPDTGFNSYFLTVFGKPENSSACECERSSEANLAQSLHLLNSSEVQGKLSSNTGRAAVLAGEKERAREDKVRELYLRVYSREPQGDELAVAAKHLEKSPDEKLALEDILWALVNTKEFLFNH